MKANNAGCKGCWRRRVGLLAQRSEMKGKSWWLNAAFPLTLTLSLEEREQPLDTGLKLVGYRAEGSLKFAKNSGTKKPDKGSKHPGRRIVFLEMP
jgi:hypothetical protein